eukprot:2592625-Amphidinium_carterae.1
MDIWSALLVCGSSMFSHVPFSQLWQRRLEVQEALWHNFVVTARVIHSLGYENTLKLHSKINLVTPSIKSGIGLLAMPSMFRHRQVKLTPLSLALLAVRAGAPLLRVGVLGTAKELLFEGSKPIAAADVSIFAGVGEWHRVCEAPHGFNHDRTVVL